MERTIDRVTTPPSRWPLAALLLAVPLLIPLGRPLLGLPPIWRLLLGGLALTVAVALLVRESPPWRRPYLILAGSVVILAVAPIDTRLDPVHMLVLSTFFAAVVFVPAWLLGGRGVLSFRLWPDRIDPLDLIYTLASVPLAWLAFRLYFLILSPEVPFNWPLPPEPDPGELVKLFLGINAVGVWDELFFINTVYAILRYLFPARIANPAQAVFYVSVLYDMAFSGWGPLLVAILALTQGLMFERSRVLLWVLIVHLVVDYFLFQGIVESYYPDLVVWWHP